LQGNVRKWKLYIIRSLSLFKKPLKLRHPDLVGFLGYCITNDDFMDHIGVISLGQMGLLTRRRRLRSPL
ncbi:hypothetical protein M8C21_025437, partial [Ambrosia artemisiifolia]